MQHRKRKHRGTVHVACFAPDTVNLFPLQALVSGLGANLRDLSVLSKAMEDDAMHALALNCPLLARLVIPDSRITADGVSVSSNWIGGSCFLLKGSGVLSNLFVAGRLPGGGGVAWMS